MNSTEDATRMLVCVCSLLHMLLSVRSRSYASVEGAWADSLLFLLALKLCESLAGMVLGVYKYTLSLRKDFPRASEWLTCEVNVWNMENESGSLQNGSMRHLYWFSFSFLQLPGNYYILSLMAFTRKKTFTSITCTPRKMRLFVKKQVLGHSDSTPSQTPSKICQKGRMGDVLMSKHKKLRKNSIEKQRGRRASLPSGTDWQL